MAKRQRWPKSKCVVPFCTRTSTLFPGEWMCGEHWRLIDKDLKLLRRRLVKRWKKRGWWGDGQHWRQINRVLDGLWRRMKRSAIEKAALIG